MPTFPSSGLRNFLTTRRLYGLQYFFAALFGAITPFCSCSSIPLFIGFVKGGIPLGITFAYLITSPLVNEVAIAMFAGSFGLRVTVIYVASGILLGMIGGFVLGEDETGTLPERLDKTDTAAIVVGHRHLGRAAHTIPETVAGHR